MKKTHAATHIKKKTSPQALPVLHLSEAVTVAETETETETVVRDLKIACY